MTPIHSHRAHPSALFIDSGPHSLPYSLFLLLHLYSLMQPASYLHFLALCPTLLPNTSSSYPDILTPCLVISILPQISLHCLHLLSLCLSLSHSLKFTPNVTPISTYHSHSAPDSHLIVPILPHSTPTQSHSASNSTLFAHLGPHFPHLTRLGPRDWTFIPSPFASQYPVTHLPLLFTSMPSHPAQHYLQSRTHFSSFTWADSHWDPCTSLEHSLALSLSNPSLPSFTSHRSPSPL